MRNTAIRNSAFDVIVNAALCWRMSIGPAKPVFLWIVFACLSSSLYLIATGLALPGPADARRSSLILYFFLRDQGVPRWAALREAARHRGLDGWAASRGIAL